MPSWQIVLSLVSASPWSWINLLGYLLETWDLLLDDSGYYPPPNIDVRNHTGDSILQPSKEKASEPSNFLHGLCLTPFSN